MTEDERSIANRLASESKKDDGDEDSFEVKLLKKDPTAPVSANPFGRRHVFANNMTRLGHTATSPQKVPRLMLRSRRRRRRSSPRRMQRKARTECLNGRKVK